MNSNEAKKRAIKLREVINYHRYLYHVLDKQEISDEALDSLKHELKILEDRFPKLVAKDSPTQRVGGAPLASFKKIRHTVPMLSIEDIFTKEELDNWGNYLKRLTSKGVSFFGELKVDGLALSLKYKNGLLEQASTRGNGVDGEDVTLNARTIESIPLKISIFKKLNHPKIKNKLSTLLTKGVVEVRGEVFINKDDFTAFNKEREKRGEASFANPRNLAAGSVRQLNSKLTALRPLSFLAYDIVTDLGCDTHSLEHEMLNVLGFKTDSTAKRCKDLDEAYAYWENIQNKRSSIPYQVDGVVVTVDDNTIFFSLGIAGKSPRGVRAFKFTPKQATTVVKDVKFHTGRTGAVTPIAILSPAHIGGVTITRATLHNLDEIKRLDVKIGDTVIIERAGDVIPKIISVLKNLRNKNVRPIRLPAHCPQCKIKLIRKTGEVILRCPNNKCESRQIEHIKHLVSRQAFDIKGFGPKIIIKLLEADLISDPADIFSLNEGDFMQLKGFKEKSSKNLINAIEKGKKISLARFINALNIRYVGSETALDLAKFFGSIDRLKKTTLSELNIIEGMGEVTARYAYEWFKDKHNLDFIDKLLKVGVAIEKEKLIRKKLKGKVFIFTGTLKHITRDDAKKRVNLLGGSTSSSISLNTSFVVLGANPGFKYDKAKKLGIKIIKEKEFLKLTS